MHSPPSYKLQRGLPVLPMLLIYICLLINPTVAHNHAPPIHRHKRNLTSQPTPQTAANLSPSLTPIKPPSPHNHSTNPLLQKRDDALDFHNLVCSGDWLINNVIKRTTLTGNVWKESDLDAAYFWDADEPFQPSPNILPALRDLGIPHERDEVNYVEINQNVPFVIGGREYPPTNGRYHNAYISAGPRSTIIAQHNYSPKHQVPPGTPIPQLYRWSDVVWLAWTLLTEDRDRGQLRYIIRENIVTPSTRKWMEYIKRAAPDTNFLPWPGQMWDLGEEEGKALLATRHGVGVAYLVADHSDVLGGKKYPAVCIFTAPTRQEDRPEKNDYYMIWELQDATEYGDAMDLDGPRTCRNMI